MRNGKPAPVYRGLEGMLFTVGYQTRTVENIRKLTDKLKAILVDCRSNPVSRKAGFNRKSLEKEISAYKWMGEHLGGRTVVTGEGIEYLRSGLEVGQNMLLMCMEESPLDCHRYHTICSHMFPEAIHIVAGDMTCGNKTLAKLDRIDIAKASDARVQKIHAELIPLAQLLTLNRLFT